MSQALANPESSDSPENNHPPKVKNKNKKTDMIDILNKLNATLTRGLLIIINNYS